MKAYQKAVAAIALLLATVSASPAQQFNSIPDKTVIGRIGAGSGTGPAQAIPFTTLGAKLSGQLIGGTARMFPHESQTTSPSDCYTLIDPYGNPIACSSSTTTQGLQEFLNATSSKGWPAAVYCQGTYFPSKTEPVYINATTSVTVPVAQDWSFHSYGCNLNFNLTTNSGLIIDSQGASVFDWDGKIVYGINSSNGNTSINPSCAVLIKPQTATADGFPGLYAGYLRIKSPVVNLISGDKATGVVCIDSSTGSTIQQTLDFTEVNGGGAVSSGNAYHGIFLIGATATTGFQQNITRVQQIHGVAADGVNAGWSSSNAAQINSNRWEIGSINGNTSNTRGIDTWSSYDAWDIGRIDNAEGGLQYGILTESTAVNNKFSYGQVSGANTSAVLDGGTCNSFWGTPYTAVALYGLTSGCTKLIAGATASGTLTLPSATDTLVGRATTDTLTNKTLTSPTLTSPTLTSPTLTSPTITGGTINNTVIGGTTPAAGSFTTITASGTVSGAGITSLFAAPPAIGGTTPAAGTFTNLTLTGSSLPANGIYLATTNTLGFAVNSLQALQLRPTTSAVNYAYIKGASTGGGGNRVTYGAAGSDTDVGIDFIAQGAGTINFNGQGSNAGAIARLTTFGAGNANGILITSAASGGSPTIQAQDLGGTGNSNIDLGLGPIGTGTLKLLNSGSFSTNGSVATSLGSVGPTGSHTTVQKWLTIKDSSGTTLYVPAF